MRIACPLCEGPSSFVFETGEQFNYRRCETCHAIFLADPPEDLARYAADGELPALDGRLLDLISPHADAGRLVAVASESACADAAREAGYDVTTIDDAEPATLAELPPSRVIAMWSALAELEDPWASLDAAARNLEPGGVLAVAMPNPGSFQFRLTRGRWPNVDAPRRRFLIPAGLLDERARSFGLALVGLTTSGPSTLFSNKAGWQRFLAGRRSHNPGAFARFFGAAIAMLAAPMERTDLRGSTYAAVYEKPDKGP